MYLPDDLEAIVITHHHGDHGGGALIAQKRWKVPVYANHRTSAELGLLPELTRRSRRSTSYRSTTAFPSCRFQSPIQVLTMLPSWQAMEENVQQSSRIWVVGQMSWCIMSEVANISQSRQTMTETD